MSGQPKKKSEYNKAVKLVEVQLLAVQQQLEQEQQRRRELVETNLILCELIWTQQRIDAIYKKQQAWLSAGGPPAGATAEHVAAACKHVGGSGSDPMQWEPVPENSAHWVLYCLESTRWDVLQTGQQMTWEDWRESQTAFIYRLMELTEVNKREPELQVS